MIFPTIYTGNFANAKKYLKKGYSLVSIALGPPKTFKGHDYKKLAPQAYMIGLPETTYIAEYRKRILNNLSPRDVMFELSDISTLDKGRPLVLLCYEKKGDFCHRQLVAEWLTRNLNIEVLELGDLSDQEPSQLGLF